MDSEQRKAILIDLIAALSRRRLLAPAQVFLDIVDPLAFFAGQAALFIRPLAPVGRWREYLTALDDEEGWKLLHTLVDE
jgi:hypothetical protein